MNLNRPAIGHGPLAEAELDRSPAPRIPRTCNNNCNQGRMCDCVGDLDDDGPRAPLSTAEAACLVFIAVVSLSIVAALALHLWRAVS